MRPRTRFPRLNSRFDVKHIREDLNMGGLADREVYDLAVETQRILVTGNIKHFRFLAGAKADAGIIGVTAQASTNFVDTKLTALLMQSTPKTLHGKYTALTRKTGIRPA